jgi:hypothetical protein
MMEKPKIEMMTADTFHRIVEVLQFNQQDTAVKAAQLFDELERQGILSSHYKDLYARLGRCKLKVERQVKYVRGKVELEYRRKIKTIDGIAKMTDATVKACVEVDEEVCESEDLLIEVTWWYNQAANYAMAMDQRMDIMRMLQKEKDR